MLLHCFNVDTFHYLLSLHDSSILSFHFVVERLELQREAGTGPDSGRLGGIGMEARLPHRGRPCALEQAGPAVELGGCKGWVGMAGVH